MKAIVCTKFGSPEVLQLREIKTPVVKDNEVLIKIIATSVTYGDTVLRGLTIPKLIVIWPVARLIHGIKKLRKKVLGHEYAGIVVEVGDRVKKFKTGDSVFGSTGYAGGAHAEYICIPENGILEKKPLNMGFEEAAAVPIGGMCALYFLRKGNIRKGQKVLINGASGSIGTFAVQIAKYLGADVTGVCSTRNIELVKSLGANHVIDYYKEDFTKGTVKYDLIFDTVRKTSYAKVKNVLTKNGQFVSTKSPTREKLEHLVFLKEIIEAGKLMTVIDRKYPLKEVAEAHRYIEKGSKIGNVVVVVQKV